MDDSVHAIVQKVILGGRHGPYAVATSDAIAGSITFSLSGDVWAERRMPERGVAVVLSELERKRAGWRAMNGRFFKPADEQQPTARRIRR